MTVSVVSQASSDYLFKDFADTFEKGNGAVRLWKGVVTLTWFGDDNYFSGSPRVMTLGKAGGEDGREGVGVAFKGPPD